MIQFFTCSTNCRISTQFGIRHVVDFNNNNNNNSKLIKKAKLFLEISGQF